VPDGTPWVHVHATALHEARNAALAQVESPFCIHLDADDELEPLFVEAMTAGTADLRAPAVGYVQPNGRAARPYVPKVAGHRHDCSGPCLIDGNFLVVGTMARTELLREVGGWEPFTWSEDWALWSRCWKAGATIEAIPSAIYRAHVNPASRNRAPDRAAKAAAHWEIHRAVWPELYEEAA
jgi:cellulose synthase/poly-beta-1,6-N-acetylglucosamine synthase-like glycosyltransferase